MREPVRVSARLLTVMLTMGAATATASSDPARTIDLTGSWTLERDLSEPPRTLRQRSGPLKVGFGIEAPSRPPTVEELAMMRTVVLEAVDPAPAVTIAQTSADVTVSVGDGQGYTFITDGRTRKQPSSVGPMEIKARWKDGRLVVETRLEGGLKTTRTLWLDETSVTRALVVLIKVEGGKLPNAVQARYVYHATKT